MAHPITSRKRARAFSLALFFIGIAVLIFLQSAWPGILLAVGIPLALRQYLMGRSYEMWLSLFIFGVGFFTVQFDISWNILLPVLFVIGAVYIFLREIYESSVAPEDESEEDKNLEIEEEEFDNKKS
jgi:hypothetical protein